MSNELGMRGMQERGYEKRGEQNLLNTSPPPVAATLDRWKSCSRCIQK
jgi:hypothetical protein